MTSSEIKLDCVRCGNPLENSIDPEVAAAIGLNVTRLKVVCAKCERLVEQSRKRDEIEARIVERERVWKLTCPSLFLGTVTTQLPRIPFERAMRWRYCPKGMLLIGPTGVGKTRIMWEVMRRLYLEGYIVRGMTEMEFALTVNKKFGANDWSAWVEQVVGVPVLFLDNLGAAKITERVAEQMLHVLDERFTRERPLLCTTQLSGEELKERFGANEAMRELGAALVRRLREFCELVSVHANVSAPPQPTKTL